MTKILILGGAGYIGSHVNKLLNLSGYETIVLDNLSTGNPNAVTHGEFIYGDMANSELLDDIMHRNKIDAVMHFAAYIDVGESVISPADYYRNNVVNTLNVLNAMLRHQIKFFIFSSTAAIFGKPEKVPICEETQVNPINPYGESKLMVEKILKNFDAAYGLKYCSLRYFNAAGGDPDGEIKNYKQRESNLIPVALKSLLNPQGKLIIFGDDYPTTDGTCVRDYIHVMDLGKAHIYGLEKLLKDQSSSQYNLGNGKGFSVKEVIQAIKTVTKREFEIITGSRREGDPPVLFANSKKAQEELGWYPDYPELEIMIEHAWKSIHKG